MFNLERGGGEGEKGTSAVKFSSGKIHEKVTASGEKREERGREEKGKKKAQDNRESEKKGRSKKWTRRGGIDFKRKRGAGSLPRVNRL